MNKLFQLSLVICFISGGSVFASMGGGTSANLLREQRQFVYRVIPFESYREENGLPSRLKISFQLKCSQKFIKTVRSDEVDTTTGKTTVAVGVLVKEDLESFCETTQYQSADAGKAFSGREYEIVSIQ